MEKRLPNKRTVEATVPDRVSMMTLSAFASIDETPLPNESVIAQERRMLSDLQAALSSTVWTPLWVGLSGDPERANVSYIARSSAFSPQAYAVVIRGTDFDIKTDWQEDFEVAPPPVGFTVGSQTVQIAAGALQGHTYITQAQGADGRTMLEALAGFAGGGGARVFVTGHSLGGALSTTVALYLENARALAETFYQVYTFAAPTVGLSDFAKLFDTTFNGSDFNANSSWRVYNSWDLIPQCWAPGTLSGLSSWYPRPGPSQVPAVQAIIKGLQNRPKGLQYTQPTVNPIPLNNPSWAAAYMDSGCTKETLEAFMCQVAFQHDNNTYLTLMGAKPVSLLSGLTPNAVAQGTALKNISLKGYGFTSSATVSFPGSGIKVDSYLKRTPSKIDLLISVPKSAVPGIYNVTVANGGGPTTYGGTGSFAITTG
jgi:Lipase (class 3)